MFHYRHISLPHIVIIAYFFAVITFFITPRLRYWLLLSLRFHYTPPLRYCCCCCHYDYHYWCRHIRFDTLIIAADGYYIHYWAPLIHCCHYFHLYDITPYYYAYILRHYYYAIFFHYWYTLIITLSLLFRTLLLALPLLLRHILCHIAFIIITILLLLYLLRRRLLRFFLLGVILSLSFFFIRCYWYIHMLHIKRVTLLLRDAYYVDYCWLRCHSLLIILLRYAVTIYCLFDTVEGDTYRHYCIYARFTHCIRIFAFRHMPFIAALFTC